MGQSYNVLIVEDDESWRDIYSRAIKAHGWKGYVFDRIDPALQMIREGNVQFDTAFIDKGGSGFWTGEPDYIGHRDGLRVLQELMREQPACIRVLGTGEPYRAGAFDNPDLGVQIFFDKRRCYAPDLIRAIEGRTSRDFEGRPLLIPTFNNNPRFRGREAE
jgi:DNA-binding NtrC family response regulator